MVDEALTRMLATYNTYSLEPGNTLDPHPHEIRYLEELRKEVVGKIPQDVTYEWFLGLLHDGPGQNHPLFDYLANEATQEEMVWFLTQEVAGEAGFDDLVAMTQVRMPIRAKLEMATNYWDEMGQGEERGMHGKLLDGVATYFSLHPTLDGTVSEALALSNLMVGLARHRRYAWQSVGALGAIEMTAPGRVSQVDTGLARLGVPKAARRYFSLHATLDVKHSRDWNREVVEPNWLAHGQAIAEGGYLRLLAGSQCFSRYVCQLGLEEKIGKVGKVGK